MTSKTNVILFRLIYFIVYFADALFTPFYGLYLRGLKFSDTQIGILLGLIPFSACLGSLFIGRLGTSFRHNILLLKIIALWEAIGVILLAFLTNFYLLVGVVILLAFVNGVYYQIEDGASSFALQKEGKPYNSVRIFGSLGFGVALVVCFFVLKVSPYRWLFVSAAGLFVAVFVLLFFLRPYSDEDVPVKKEKGRGLQGIFSNRAFVFFFLFYFLLDGVISIQGYILPLYLNSLGLSDSDYSLLSAFRVGIEIIAVFFYQPIKKWLKNDRNCLLVGGGILFLSTIFILVFQNPWAIAFGNYFCRGLGGALLFIGFVNYLSSILPHAQVTTGLALCAAMMDIFTGAMNFSAPAIYQSVTFLGFFAINSGIALLGYVFLFFSKGEKETRLEEAKRL
jgi:PPP family 3-phenylpropionic acid transporter